uniref:Putative KilA-N domain-containing protein n=1 Tax=viral metagenome TaxID=1070528 RepID=A0A6M3L074_9ZZZZ
MKTEVIMKRELFGEEVSQQSKTEFFSATDLVRAGNVWRRANGYGDFNITAWWNRKDTTEFIKELEKKYGKVFSKGRGHGNHTWVHPLLFIDIALSISPKLKIEVYEWLFDHLIRFRNESGDSYKKMCGALWVRATNKKNFTDDIKKVANIIKIECNVKDWQQASEAQLKMRDRMHENIALLADVLNNNREAIRIGIQKSKPIPRGADVAC